MYKSPWDAKVESIDPQRDLIVPGNPQETLLFCVEHFVRLAQEAIASRGLFSVALSGGSTPKAIYEKLSMPPFSEEVDWKRVFLFWSDERAVPAHDPHSNYQMAMQAGLQNLPLLPEHIFRMRAEEQIEKHALEYEKQIEATLPEGVFDLVMLGIGEDGHTASLFPQTHALKTEGRLVVANYVPSLSSWRMTLTYDCIARARLAAVYVLGSSKCEILKRIFFSQYDPDLLPAQKVGTPTKKSLWITDIPRGELIR